MQIGLDAGVFRAWLERNAEHMVGWTCNDKLTPIAEWLMGKYGREFFVTDESIVMGFFEECVVSPPWVARFVRASHAGAVDTKTALHVVHSFSSGEQYACHL